MEMNHRPEWRAALRKQFLDLHPWHARGAVAAAAVLAGLSVVGFTWLSEHALTLFFRLQSACWWGPLLWTPLCTVLIVWLTRLYVPGAAGSGIPQAMAALETGLDPVKRGLFVSLKLSVAKIFLTAWGLLGGLSMGREGPSVQIAAGVMLLARRLAPRDARPSPHTLLVAGGAAGIAAAFNTPLAGIMFAIEELSRTPEHRNSALIVTAIVLAGLVSVSFHGNATYFGVIHASAIGLPLFWSGLMVTLACGVAGGIFSRLLIVSLSGDGRDLASGLRARHPVLFAGLCGLAVAVLGVVTAGATFGSGYAATRSMVDGAGGMPASYPLFKFIATWLSAWSGAPAGIFAPSLAIGAGLGNDVAMLINAAPTPALIGLGMVGFLAAVTQAPLTSFIIVMEMVDGHAMVLSLMACALVASAISRAISPPLYATLAGFQLRRI
ncbi:chloride channel protein [Pseudoduganella namucuonensis]|uniref:H+/Cl-antiporter ClcA n=1 Tax=Pseudoduganella namucuonensis TaxID=1035707 RepID=A0A1I7K8Y8_9BURK|nr:chloride channel protein [Pseudoduganella namucuonensis]SFU93887.1 H+/Cl-antiporter ClcA [Pseudoduganella namucuonensis]